MDQATATMIAKLESSTGKSLDDWVRIARATGASRHGEIVKVLKEAHGLTHGYANLVTHRALESDASFSEAGALVDAQYAGAKEGLRGVWEAIRAAVAGFGSDVEIAPKKGYVSLRRSKQFALVQPSTATRVDVGINLKGVPPGKRLETSGSWNTMVTHRVRIGSPGEVDAELVGWLRDAYDRA